MYKVQFFIIHALLVLMVSSCVVDNYEGPDAELHGTFIDSETKEPVQSEIVEGTVVQLIELGWVEDPTDITQSLVVQSDGTYRNSMIFSGEYRVQAAQGNFQPIAPIESLEINGRTNLDFEVTPYLRIKDANIAKNGNVVTATFRIEKTTDDAITSIGLYSHPHKDVGFNTSLVLVESTEDLNSDPDKLHTLEIDLNNQNFVSGRSYYFRIGARSSASGARHNYSEAVNVQI